MDFDPDKYLQEKQSAGNPGFDPDKYLGEKTGVAPEPKYSQAQAGLEHFGNAGSLGYLPHLQALTQPAVFGIMNKITGQNIPAEGYIGDDSYTKARDENIARLSEEEKEYPKTALASSVAGAIGTAPLLPGPSIAKSAGLLSKMRAAGIAGAAYGALSNPGDKPGQQDALQLPERIENAGAGLAAGAITAPAIEGLINVPKAAGWAGKKALSALGGGVKEDVINEFLADPKRYLDAAPREQVVDAVQLTMDELEKSVTEGKTNLDDAKETLGQLQRSLKETNSNKAAEIRSMISDTNQRLDSTYKSKLENLRTDNNPTVLQPEIQDSLRTLKQKVVQGSQDAMEILEKHGENIPINDLHAQNVAQIKSLSERGSDAAQGAARKLQSYSDLIFKNGSTDKDGNFSIAPEKIKSIIKDIDSDVGVWSNQTGSFDDPYTQTLKGLRSQLDGAIKTSSPDYKSKMAEVADAAKLLSGASQAFGKPQTAINRLVGIARPSSEEARGILSRLGEATGKDFTTPINQYAENQGLLRSKTKLDELKQGLPEYKELQGLIGQQSLLKRASRPENFRSVIEGSPEFANRNAAQEALEQAKANSKTMRGWSSQNVESKIQSVINGTERARNQLAELGKMSDQDFVKMVDNLRVNESFEKDATRGSKNVNLWKAIGTAVGTGVGSIAGHPVYGGMIGHSAGAAFGALVDKYGPPMTKQILIGISNIKGSPTMQKLTSVGLPDRIANDLMLQYKLAIGPEAGGLVGVGKSAINQANPNNKFFKVGEQNKETNQ